MASIIHVLSVFPIYYCGTSDTVFIVLFTFKVLCLAHCYVFYNLYKTSGWTVLESNPGWGEIFPARPDQLRDPPSLL
jgi:hypothetical protein